MTCVFSVTLLNGWEQHLSGGNQHASGIFSLLYGLQGSYINANDLNFDSPLLTRTLKEQGYHLGLFTTDNVKAYPQAIFNDFRRFSSTLDNNYAEADKQSVVQFTQWQTEQNVPWFALLNLRAPASYDTPVGFLGIETVRANKEYKPAQRVLFNQYRQSLNFIDQTLAKLIKTLPADTLIIITGVNGSLFTSDADEARSDFSLQNVQVPLIIHWPGQAPATEIYYRTSHYGIVPTLMTQVLGCTNPPTDYSAGRSLLQPDSKSWVYVGDNNIFGIYQKSTITVIDKHGKYQIFDDQYKKQLPKQISAPELIEVMREGRRIYNH